MTAEKFLENYTPYNDDRYDWYTPNQCIEAMIEFAKLHTQEALKASFIESIDYLNGGVDIDEYEQSILKSYPLELIK